MRQGTFALSQKELQRVAVISSCVKGDLACARAASLLNLTPRHVKRLKSRLRQRGEAALAHASRGRPSHRRLPDRVRDRILHLARTTCAGFNDHHLCEKLVEKEGFSLGRETLRRLLRGAGPGSPRKRRAPTHRQRRLARALDQLGITYIAARSPQANGRIERLWGTFQDRLTSELRLAGAVDLHAANQVLRRFLPDYNRRFGRAPREAEKAWRTAPQDLDRICCFLHERSVSNDNVVQWGGRHFQVPPQPQRFSFAGARVQVHESLEGKIAIYY